MEIILPCGNKTKIDYQDEWILEKFPSWVKRKNHVAVGRSIPTEYGTAWEEYYLQRLIIKAPPNKAVDHIDRDPLNNLRSNLRIADNSQNSANSQRRYKNPTGFRGVFDKCRHIKTNLEKRYVSYISAYGKRKYLGYYKTAEEAAKAYDAEAIKIWGEYAILNFPRRSDIEPTDS